MYIGHIPSLGSDDVEGTDTSRVRDIELFDISTTFPFIIIGSILLIPSVGKLHNKLSVSTFKLLTKYDPDILNVFTPEAEIVTILLPVESLSFHVPSKDEENDEVGIGVVGIGVVGIGVVGIGVVGIGVVGIGVV